MNWDGIHAVPAYSYSLLPPRPLFYGGQRLRHLDQEKDQLFLDIPNTKPAFNTMVAEDEGVLWIRLGFLKGSAQSEWLIIEASTGNVVSDRPYVTSSMVAASWLLENFNREGCCQ